MTILATLDNDKYEDVASSHGWSLLSEWANSLDPDETPYLGHLMQYGWEQDLPGLEADLRESLGSSPPASPATRHTAEKLLAFVAGRGDGKAIAISDGING